MLLLDYDQWDETKIPVVSAMFNDGRCPCYKNECVVKSICTKVCEEMHRYTVTNLHKTLAYLRDNMGASYYGKIEKLKYQFISSSDAFECLIALQDKTGSFEELKYITNRYIFTIKRSVEIVKNMKRATQGSTPLEYFFIRM